MNERIKCSRCGAEFAAELGAKRIECSFCNMVIHRNSDENQLKVERIFRDAQDGKADAQYKLGVMYEKGDGIDQDNKKAFEWISKAMNQKYADAFFKMGYYHANGIGVSQNLKQAIDWYTKFTELRPTDRVAMNNIGYCYQNLKDYKQAYKWYIKAGTYQSAQNNLGILYRDGLGVKKDLREAFIYFSKAAEQGNEKARESTKKILTEL